MYRRQKRYDEAIAAYQKTMALDPDIFYPYFNRALAYDSLEQYEDALTDYEQYITITNDASDEYTEYAKERVAEIKERLHDTEYEGISAVVGEIKQLLQHTDGEITHLPA